MQVYVALLVSCILKNGAVPLLQQADNLSEVKICTLKV